MTEARSPRVKQCRGQRFSGGDAHAERRQVVAMLRAVDVKQARVHRRNREQHRGSLRVDQLEHARRLEPLRNQDRRGPHARGEIERIAEPEGEVELRDRENQVIGADAEHALADQDGGVHEVVMQVDGGLGLAGGARRVAPHGDVVAARVGGLEFRGRALEQAIVRQRAAPRAADHHDGREPRTSGARRDDRRRHRVARDDRARPAVVEARGDLNGRHGA